MGIFLGAFVWGVIADRYEPLISRARNAIHELTRWYNSFGRKIGYLVTALFTSVRKSDRAFVTRVFLILIIYSTPVGFASTAAGNLATMCILRGLLGFGIGGAPVAFSMYTEFLPAKNRGIVLVCFEGFWTFGILLEAGLAW